MPFSKVTRTFALAVPFTIGGTCGNCFRPLPGKQATNLTELH